MIPRHAAPIIVPLPPRRCTGAGAAEGPYLSRLPLLWPTTNGTDFSGLTWLRRGLILAWTFGAIPPARTTLAALAKVRRRQIFGGGLSVDPLYLGLAKRFDRAKAFHFLWRHDHRRVPLTPCAACAADAVHVILGTDRNIEIEDVAHIGNIEPARRDVGSGKEGYFALCGRLRGSPCAGADRDRHAKQRH